MKNNIDATASLPEALLQEQTIQERNWYARFGLQVEQYSRELDDHIGLEMSFVACLAWCALQAIKADDQTTRNALLQVQRDFLVERPLRWTSTWAKRANEHAATNFYCGMSHLSHAALLATADVLQVPLPKVVAT
jgi:TorA maturation chaperone TorD